MLGWVTIGLAAVLLVAVALQLAVPRVAAARIAAHLSADGGQAEVTVRALPVLRLLRREGDRLAVRGSSIRIGFSGERGAGLSALDGFDQVEVVLTDFVTGPFEVAELELTRIGSGPYRMRSTAITSGADLLEYGGSQFGVAGALGPIARQAPLGGRNFPVMIEVELASEAGGLRIVSGGGTIAGYPAGPAATLIAGAVARQLQLH